MEETRGVVIRVALCPMLRGAKGHQSCHTPGAEQWIRMVAAPSKRKGESTQGSRCGDLRREGAHILQLENLHARALVVCDPQGQLLMCWECGQPRRS